MKPRWLILWTAFLLPYHCVCATPAEKHFLERVKPLLDLRCISCHGPDKVKGGLRLDSRAAVLKGGNTAPAVVPGKPEESLLLQTVMHARKDLEMPPKEKLTPADITVLERWVRDGAPWPEKVVTDATSAALKPQERLGDAWTDPRNPIVRVFGGQRLDWWAVRPVQNQRLPRVKNKKWIRNPIDKFVLARLEAKNLSPSPEADKRTLARRLYFDLTGLPPSPEEMENFLNDGRGDAYERLVERLLASPRYGEHWTRAWLDVIRYSDSNGFDWDEFRPKAWMFRDYVIRSFNEDKPFDQFVREQLAGDELLSGPPTNAAEQDCLVATGYLRVGPQDNSAALFNEQNRARAELLADLTETTAGAFCALTLSCNRCHDHKYDPLSHADHYRFRAFFEPVAYADDLPLDLAFEQSIIRQHNALVDEHIAEKEKAGIKEQVEKLKKQKRLFDVGLLMTDTTNKVPVTRIFLQGDYKTEGEAVTPGFISILDPNPAPIKPPPNPKTTGRRLALANWIVSPSNPLTPRVLVNRIWQGHFGKGLVTTPNDFGFAGAPPTHPELLDWLAREFVRQKWSVKKLHRLIVTSATYRQGSSNGNDASLAGAKVDSENALLWRQNLRRLSAEQLRDSLLSASGLLKVEHTGGPPIWPELPAEILQANPAFLDDNEMKTKGWYPSPKTNQNVRSVYLIQKRSVRVPFLETFDLPENSLSCPRRNESIVPPQALALLNSPLTATVADALAARVHREAGTHPARQVERVFTLTLQRVPDDSELRACLDLLQQRSLPELCRVLLNVNEFIYVD